MTPESAPPVTFGCIGDVHAELGRLDRTLAWLADRELDALLLVGDFTAGLPPGWSRRAAALRGGGSALAGGGGPGEGSGDGAAGGGGDGAEEEGGGEATEEGGEGADPVSPVREAVQVARETGLPVRFVPGNHDVPDVPLAGNLDRRLEKLAGVRVFGVGGSGPALMGFPYEWTDEELEGLDAPERDLVLAHAPPADTRLDLTQYGEHVGSRAIRELAASTRGALVCGHVHESPGVERVEGCLCYNAGSLGAPFGRLQAGLLEVRPGTGAARARHFVHDPGAGWRCVAEGTSG